MLAKQRAPPVSSLWQNISPRVPYSPHPSLATAANVSATSGTQFKSLPQDTRPPVLADAMILTDWMDWPDGWGHLVAQVYEETGAILDLQGRAFSLSSTMI